VNHARHHSEIKPNSDRRRLRSESGNSLRVW
jgi:hypothetical protein